MQLLDSLRNAWKIADLRKRILYTLGMFLVFRAGAHVPVPGIDSKVIAEFVEKGQIFGFFDVISGGAFKNFTIFAMGIMPYINASIIVQLLTIVIPSWEAMSKEGGEEGRKKLAQYMRYGTVILALIQAIGLTYGLHNAVIPASRNFFGYTVIVLTLTAGTAFLMWLGERITENGIGNGISLIIFAGIVSRLPSGAVRLFNLVRVGTVHWLVIIILAAIALLVIAGVVAIQQGTRRIPVQYAKRVVGRKVYGGQSTHLPIRVNTAGVIPVIFASSILTLPRTFATFWPNVGWIQALDRLFDWSGVLYNVLYFLLIIFFTYFYTAVTFNPLEVANNIKKNGGFIPGIRPGRPTAEYLNRVLERITLLGAIFLAIMVIFPTILLAVFKFYVGLGGTSLLIVVGVALETMKQIEAHMLMRHYQGFLK